MVKKIVLALVLALIGFPLGCGGGPVASSAGRIRVMPMGDSITEGVGCLPGGYRRLLENELLPGLDFQFVGSWNVCSQGMRFPYHEGHSGWTIQNYIGEVTTAENYPKTNLPPSVYWVSRAHPDMILLLIGTNDGPVSVQEFERRYTKLLNQIYSAAPDVVLVWCKVLPKVSDTTGEIVENSSAAIDAVAESFSAQGKQIAVVKVDNSFNPVTMTVDGTHPNSIGCPLLEQAFEAGISSLALNPQG